MDIVEYSELDPMVREQFVDELQRAAEQIMQKLGMSQVDTVVVEPSDTIADNSEHIIVLFGTHS